MPADTGGTQVPATFCVTWADVGVTAKVSLGVTRVHLNQDTILTNAYTSFSRESETGL